MFPRKKKQNIKIIGYVKRNLVAKG